MKVRKQFKSCKYLKEYSKPLYEAQKSVAKGLYIPFLLRDKIKNEK